ncbi:hypothetical protein ACIPWL_28450 [Streptomyces sp. NPDC090023]|uniref:hypothetical protein n=1 Tax=unclassified Streptomyces TaxID=2593676 RepID=UPI003819C190
MPKNAVVAHPISLAPGEPSTEVCLRVARRAAALAVAAADNALDALCRSRAASTVRLEAVMHAAHKEAVAAEGYADHAEQSAGDPDVPVGALSYYARAAVSHAVRAQSAAGAETTAAELRAELERILTSAERAERERVRRLEEARDEAEQRATTGMDQENRLRATTNMFLAEQYVADLGWTVKHVRVMEAAETGRLYWRGGRARQAACHGAWASGRRISHERTQELVAARFLVSGAPDNDTVVLTLSAMGTVALALARLYPAGLHTSDQAAYEARLAKARRRYKRRDDQKQAARCLPPLASTAQRLYRRPVTLAEQQSQIEREAADRWVDDGGRCPAAEPVGAWLVTSR